MKILRVFNVLFASIGFLVVLLLVFTLTLRLTMEQDQFTHFLKSTTIFIRQKLQDDSLFAKHDLSTFDKFYTHSSFVFKMNNKPIKDSLFVDKISDFTVEFPNYAMLQGLFQEIFVCKIYDFKSETTHPFIIDAGSNIGISVLFFKMIYPDSDIIAFEPSKKIFTILENNIKNNNLKNVQLLNFALSNEEKEVKFYNLGSTTGTLKTDNKTSDYNFEIIKTKLLSGYINQKVDLLKMDIEGSETEVVKDLFDKNKMQYIDQIIMEYHYTPGKSNLSEVLSMLEKSGFIYSIKNNIPTPFKKLDKQQYFMIYAYKH